MQIHFKVFFLAFLLIKRLVLSVTLFLFCFLLWFPNPDSWETHKRICIFNCEMNCQFPGSRLLVSEFQGGFQVTGRRQVSEVGSAIRAQASSRMTLSEQIKSGF